MTLPGGAASPKPSAARILAANLALPAIAGAACVLGFAPFYWWPVPVVALTVLFYTWGASGSPLQAALSGFAFGLGYFLAGVSWVFVSLHVFGSMPVVLAALATFLFCAYLALFPALAGALAHWRAASRRGYRVAALPAAFVLLEWLRGWLFTGFPWLTIGTSQVPGSPLAGFAPVGGAYGTSLAVAVVAALIAASVRSNPWSRARGLQLAAIAVVFVAGGLLRLVEWSTPSGPPVNVALLQGNVPQHLKWLDEVRARTFADYGRRIVEARAAVVVLPETALPAFFDRLPPAYLQALREHAREAGKVILLGTVERQFVGERFAYYNSLVRIGAGEAQSYRKRHLVPFGEFIPPGFHWVLSVLKIPLTDFARGDTPQPALVAAGTSFAVTICYEDIFGSEVIAALPGAGVLLNVSNVAWFGESLAADQHAQASQMRALETGRWMLRSTNTGLTAAIDERGRMVSRLPQFTEGTLVVAAVPRSGTTPYVRWGDGAALVLALAMLAYARFKSGSE